MYDVLIIGCGITGAAIAFELAGYELKVGVLEAENDVAQGASKANSAILHAGFDPLPGTLMAKLNVRGVRLAAELARKLNLAYRRNGALVLGFGPEDEETLRTLYQRGLANGVERLELLTGEEARALEPALSPAVTAALHAPTSAICLPWQYCLALAETAVENGTDLFLEHRVTGIRRMGDHWQVETDRGTFESRFVVNAAGIFAGEIHAMAAETPWTIRPTRGEYYLLDKSEGGTVSHTVFQCPGKAGKGVLVSPTVHGNLIVGPNAQTVQGEDTANTAAGMSFVQERARRSVPGLNFRQSIRNFAGVRANSDAGDFIIGPAEGAPGFFDAAGICSPGLSAAPAAAEYLRECMAAAGLPLRRRAEFRYVPRPTPFSALDEKARAQLAERDPAYGRVICRCETVTEGEIVAAIHSPIPPRSVDGVKRRTNAGLGRCQGGFCGPRVVELLCRELKITPGEVLQDRRGSVMLTEPTKGGNGHV